MSDVSSKVDDFFAPYMLRKHRKGQVLLLSGERPEQVFYLVKGAVKQYDVSYRGDEVVVNVFKPGAFFPMSHAINGTVNQYIYEAETDVEFRQAPAAEVVAFLKDNPDVTFDLLSRIYRGLDGVLGRMAQLMAGSATSRVMYELVVQMRRFGDEQPDGSILITLSEKELGSRAGLTRETVSREIAKLKDSGLLKAGASGISVTNAAELEDRLAKSL